MPSACFTNANIVLSGPDLAVQVVILDIKASIFTDHSQGWEVPSGATRMHLNNWTRLEEAALAHTKSLERRSAPGVSAMVRQWRPDLRRGAQTAYLGVLLSLIKNVKDLAITILVEEGSPRRSLQPLERLFGLSIGWGDGLYMDPKPHLRLLPDLSKNVRRLQTSGANLALLCLGFDNLEILEVDLSQWTRDGTWYVCENEKVELHPCTLPKVACFILRCDCDTSSYLPPFGNSLRKSSSLVYLMYILTSSTTPGRLSTNPFVIHPSTSYGYSTKTPYRPRT
jgi:hypothetical protein